MFEYIEKFDGTSWTELTSIQLETPKSHTRSTYVKYNGGDFIFVFGGWGKELDYVSVVEIFEVTTGGGVG